jgi:uncharacterized protein (TIGR00252 family)
MTTFAVGRQAEAAAAEYLKARGHEIIQQNYRTRYCEIDIVTAKSGIIYFVEVKYRRNDSQGSGLEYITQRKLEQMQLAVEYWLSHHDGDKEYRLSALELSGENFQITNFIESLTW